MWSSTQILEALGGLTEEQGKKTKESSHFRWCSFFIKSSQDLYLFIEFGEIYPHAGVPSAGIKSISFFSFVLSEREKEVRTDTLVSSSEAVYDFLSLLPLLTTYLQPQLRLAHFRLAYSWPI